MNKLVKHYVTFLSPGTFLSEDTTLEIDSWGVEAAVRMARSVLARHNAKPYGFYFTVRTRGDEDLDSKESARSPLYYLGGKIETAEEIFARNDPKEKVLRLNIQNNGFKRIIVNENSWRFIAPLRDEDIVLDVDMKAPVE